MAKGRGNPEGTGKIEFRFVEFEMDGTDASLEEGLKSIAAALNRGMAPAATKFLRHNGAAATTVDPAAPETEQEGEEEVVAEGQEEAPRATRKASSGQRKVATRKVVEGFKLDDVSPTLKEFHESKGSPKSDLDKYLVVAAWAKEEKGLEELSVDHFYTAYKYMEWETPKDPAQPIRDLMHKRRAKFSKAITPGYGRINHIGENDVLKMGKGA